MGAKSGRVVNFQKFIATMKNIENEIENILYLGKVWGVAECFVEYPTKAPCFDD